MKNGIPSLNPDNPCFNCSTTSPGTKEVRKALCCWDVGLELSPEEYKRCFQQYSGQFSILYENGYPDPIVKAVFIKGPCPNLDQSSGMCAIESVKPENCREAQAAAFATCIKTLKKGI